MWDSSRARLPAGRKSGRARIRKSNSIPFNISFII